MNNNEMEEGKILIAEKLMGWEVHRGEILSGNHHPIYSEWKPDFDPTCWYGEYGIWAKMRNRQWKSYLDKVFDLYVRKNELENEDMVGVTLKSFHIVPIPICFEALVCVLKGDKLTRYEAISEGGE